MDTSPPQTSTASRPFPIAQYLLQHKKARPLSKLNPKNSESLFDGKKLNEPKLTDGPGIGRRTSNSAQSSHYPGARANNDGSRPNSRQRRPPTPEQMLRDALVSADKRFQEMSAKYEAMLQQAILDGDKRVQDAEKLARDAEERARKQLEAADARNDALHHTIIRLFEQKIVDLKVK